MLVFEERGKPEFPEKILPEQSRERTNSAHICIKTRSPAASLPCKGQVTEQTTVKWSVLYVKKNMVEMYKIKKDIRK